MSLDRGRTIMSVLATADLLMKPERLAELLEILGAALPDTRTFEGCEGLDVFVDQDEPGHVLLVETWAERAQHEQYLVWRQETGMFDLLAEFVSSPPQFRYFDARPDI
jgi:quinol monooxygenase YgiN